MTTKNYSILNSFVHKVGATRAGIWLFSRVLHHIDRVMLQMTHQRTTLTSVLAGLPVVVLTTTGARSGLPRSLPLYGLCIEPSSGEIALIASNFGQSHHPSWYHNLKANPQAICSIDGQSAAYLAHEAQGEEYSQLWQAASESYLGFERYKKLAANRKIPIMVLTPLGYENAAV